jgi:hypothetical protein
MVNNTTLVSDIDDTIKWSHILSPEASFLDALDYHLAFKGCLSFTHRSRMAGPKLCM